MEMEPLPGFTLTSWERGYGDMKMVPDLATLRLIPWLPRTALVFCDVYTEEGEPIEEAPRWILKRQIERARGLGYVVKTAAELELYCFQESFEEARAKRYHDLTPVSAYLEDYHILQTTKEEPLIRAIRNGMEGAGIPVETSKGEWGRGQEEINLEYAEALEMADRATLYKHGAKEIAHLQGCSVTFMAKYDMGAAGSSFHLHSSLWDRRGRRRSSRRAAVRAVGIRPCAAVRSLAGRPDGDGPRAGLLLRAVAELLQALPVGLLRADADRRRLGQPHVRLPPVRGGARRSASRTASPAPTPIRISPSPPPSPPGCMASPEARGAQALRGQRLRGRHAAAGSQDAARGGRASSAARRSRGPRSASASSSITCTRLGSSSRLSTRR